MSAKLLPLATKSISAFIPIVYVYQITIFSQFIGAYFYYRCLPNSYY